MSFLSIIKRIGSIALGIEHVAEPIVSTLIPASQPVFAILDPIFAKLQNAIMTVEVNKPIGTPGNVSSDAVIADFEASLELAQSIASAAGQVVTYDKAELQNAINFQVSALNSMAKVKASIKMSPKT